jgi:phosphatidylglycerophosphate synthase
MSIFKRKKRKIQSAERVSQALTAGVEKKVLIWIAQRLPTGISSDQLTIFAIVISAFGGLSYYLTRYSPWWFVGASIGFIGNWLGDSLDGTVARVRDQRREQYGLYFDHICDMVSILLFGLGLSFSPYITPVMPLLMVIAYYLLSMHTFLMTIALSKFKLSYGLFGPTEFRIFIIIINTLMLWWGDWQISAGSLSFTLLDIVIGATVVMFFFVYATQTIKALRYLNTIDPLPKPSGKKR